MVTLEVTQLDILEMFAISKKNAQQCHAKRTHRCSDISHMESVCARKHFLEMHQVPHSPGIPRLRYTATRFPALRAENTPKTLVGCVNAVRIFVSDIHNVKKIPPMGACGAFIK